MPGLNRTGPEGQGSKTGRGLGKCNPSQNDETKTTIGNSEVPPESTVGFGRGLGRALGRGGGGGGMSRRGNMGRGRNQGRRFG